MNSAKRIDPDSDPTTMIEAGNIKKKDIAQSLGTGSKKAKKTEGSEYCSNCGELIDKDSKFCKHCGSEKK